MPAREQRPAKCLLLAAGSGQRLQAKGGRPKPLTRLLGLSLLERAILTARQAGCAEVIVVLGFEGEKIEKALGDGRRLGVRLTFIHNPNWERGNGASALAGKAKLNEPFLLMMSDHVMDPEVLRLLQRESLDGAAVLLAVDRRPAPYMDLIDATKVQLNGHWIAEIGKALPTYDALDMGAFFCTPELFQALESTSEDGSLTAAIRFLARQNRVRAVDATGRFWMDIDTQKALKDAEKWMLAQLSKPTDGPIAQLLNRPFSRQLTRWLVNTKITPNQLSWLSFLTAAFGAFFLGLGNFPGLALGGVLTQLSSVLDGCDGEVARLKFLESAVGGWFDATLDRYADALIVGGLSLGAWKITRKTLSWLWGMGALSGAFLISYTADKYEGLLRKKLSEGKHSLRMRRDVRLFLIFLGSLIHKPLETLVALTLFSHTEVFRRIWLMLKESA